MKRFLIRILGACLIPLPLGVLAVFMYFAEVKTYYRDLVLPPDVTITASDDSIISLGVDPAYFPHFANRSAAGMGMAAGEVRLKDLAKRHPGQLKTVLLGLSTTKFCMPRDGRIGNSERGKAFLWILHPELRKTCPMREGENVYSLFFQAEIPKRLRKFTQSLFSRKKKFLSDAAGRFEPIDTCEFMENPAKVRDQLQEFLRLQCEVSGAQKSSVLRQSASFVRTAQSNGLEVVLVKMPVHKVLRKGYRPEVLSSYHAACDQLRRQFNLRMLDYTEWNDSEAFWQNINHLNAHGAALFTKELVRDFGQNSGNL